MQDRVPLYPGRVKLNPVSGQENTYDMVRADAPTQVGTPLSKDTFLKDSTAALFGLGTDAVPDDAFNSLAKSAGCIIAEYPASIAVKAGDVCDVENGQAVTKYTAEPTVKNKLYNTSLSKNGFVTKINKDYFLVSYSDNNITARYHLISAKTGNQVGSYLITKSTANTNGAKSFRLTDDMFVLGVSSNSILYFNTASIVSKQIQLNKEASIGSGTSSYWAATRLNDSQFFLAYLSGNSTYCTVGTVTDKKIYFSSVISFDFKSYYQELITISDSKVLMLYQDLTNKDVKAVIFSVSGSVISMGEQISLGMVDTYQGGLSYTKYRENQYIISRNRISPDNGNGIWLALLTISGDTCSVGPVSVAFPDESTSPTNAFGGVFSIRDRYFILQRQNGRVSEVTVSGNSIVVSDSYYDLLTGSEALNQCTVCDSDDGFTVVFYYNGTDGPTSYTLDCYKDLISGRIINTASTAIALNSAEPGETVTLVYDGNISTDIKNGTRIDSNGVKGEVIEGKLSVFSKFAAESGTRIETGRYYGTGTYGVDNRSSLTFAFKPKMVLIQCEEGGSERLSWQDGVSCCYFFSGSTDYAQYTNISGNTLTWYNGNNAAFQVNDKRYYRYIAIG